MYRFFSGSHCPNLHVPKHKLLNKYFSLQSKSRSNPSFKENAIENKEITKITQPSNERTKSTTALQNAHVSHRNLQMIECLLQLKHSATPIHLCSILKKHYANQIHPNRSFYRSFKHDSSNKELVSTANCEIRPIEHHISKSKNLHLDITIDIPAKKGKTQICPVRSQKETPVKITKCDVNSITKDMKTIVKHFKKALCKSKKKCVSETPLRKASKCQFKKITKKCGKAEKYLEKFTCSKDSTRSKKGSSEELCTENQGQIKKEKPVKKESRKECLQDKDESLCDKDFPCTKKEKAKKRISEPENDSYEKLSKLKTLCTESSDLNRKQKTAKTGCVENKKRIEEIQDSDDDTELVQCNCSREKSFRECDAYRSEKTDQVQNFSKKEFSLVDPWECRRACFLDCPNKLPPWKTVNPNKAENKSFRKENEEDNEETCSKSIPEEEDESRIESDQVRCPETSEPSSKSKENRKVSEEKEFSLDEPCNKFFLECPSKLPPWKFVKKSDKMESNLSSNEKKANCPSKSLQNEKDGSRKEAERVKCPKKKKCKAVKTVKCAKSKKIKARSAQRPQEQVKCPVKKKCKSGTSKKCKAGSAEKVKCPEKVTCPEKVKCPEKVTCPEKVKCPEKVTCPEKVKCPKKKKCKSGKSKELKAGSVEKPQEQVKCPEKKKCKLTKTEKCTKDEEFKASSLQKPQEVEQVKCPEKEKCKSAKTEKCTKDEEFKASSLQKPQEAEQRKCPEKKKCKLTKTERCTKDEEFKASSLQKPQEVEQVKCPEKEKCKVTKTEKCTKDEEFKASSLQKPQEAEQRKCPEKKKCKLTKTERCTKDEEFKASSLQKPQEVEQVKCPEKEKCKVTKTEKCTKDEEFKASSLQKPQEAEQGKCPEKEKCKSAKAERCTKDEEFKASSSQKPQEAEQGKCPEKEKCKLTKIVKCVKSKKCRARSAQKSQVKKACDEMRKNTSAVILNSPKKLPSEQPKSPLETKEDKSLRSPIRTKSNTEICTKEQPVLSKSSCPVKAGQKDISAGDKNVCPKKQTVQRSKSSCPIKAGQKDISSETAGDKKVCPKSIQAIQETKQASPVQACPRKDQDPIIPSSTQCKELDEMVKKKSAEFLKLLLELVKLFAMVNACQVRCPTSKPHPNAEKSDPVSLSEQVYKNLADKRKKKECAEKPQKVEEIECPTLEITSPLSKFVKEAKKRKGPNFVYRKKCGANKNCQTAKE